MKHPAYVLASAFAFAALAGCSSVGPTQRDLVRDGAEPSNVVTYGLGYSQQRYSRLDQINKSNVQRLAPVWNATLDNELGEQAQPLVYDGVIYVSNARWTFAFDALTGKELWRTAVGFPPETPRVVCCGVSNKGVALYNGKVFRTTLDAHVVAMDMKTGAVLWKQKAAEWKEGYSQTVAPLIASGVLVTGISGAEFGIRGFLDGWDPDTGKHLWRRHTTAGPGESGHETWEPRQAYSNGGGSTWITGSYDPDLDLMYWGTGNAGPWNPIARKGDNLYTASVIAVRPKTGEIAWHYQFTPNDVFDWDAVWELILADIPVDGVTRKVAMQMNRNGFLYVLDRTNGKLLSAKPYGKVTWATHVDMATGRPVESEQAKKLRAGEKIEMYPSVRGAKNWPHAAFNPNTGLLYANTNEGYSIYRFTDLTPYQAGARYQGVENSYAPVKPGDVVGHIEAIDPLTAKPKWRIPQKDIQVASAMLATAGGLLFTGRHTGELIALDADTGATLWEHKTSSGINSMPVTWSRGGKQYVTVLSGLGGLYGTRNREQLKEVPLGGSIWTFALTD
jgi:alcohol dehydrogenase (cytochrome c)